MALRATRLSSVHTPWRKPSPPPPPWARPPGDGRPPIRTIGPQRGRLLPGHREAFERLADRYVVPVVVAGRPGTVRARRRRRRRRQTVALADGRPRPCSTSPSTSTGRASPSCSGGSTRADIDNVVVVEADVWDVLGAAAAGVARGRAVLLPRPVAEAPPPPAPAGDRRLRRPLRRGAGGRWRAAPGDGLAPLRRADARRGASGVRR